MGETEHQKQWKDWGDASSVPMNQVVHVHENTQCYCTDVNNLSKSIQLDPRGGAREFGIAVREYDVSMDMRRE